MAGIQPRALCSISPYAYLTAARPALMCRGSA